ncbi:MAG: hypothetical protein A3A80_00920 [Candidatus Terrybacteria bacterium RIFCSPLOWO2_01_FULL_44_24]|uniref:SUF system FeS cluster assembly SufBD core domain-containing protein n=1 Tax=Candidatus Terrybacteria bacterium RIFCSPHIGHO2_01_FULL_43_35 TaxID=1802361 RepID=A0A1G2PFL2_9BACT|nr:MAG: hypothetical protein A2828_04205 [Candidatus Terrybacteria bacterium RIFCSPHIGHO2_01_FULL_43_35]OHA49868.1 MAG: hypothetical protein A3B75_03095 [Candidatus Terrybacteria bacterium RIFCSPHIGHO2_02_FULL_43_14]OHA50704.1 MAG: hypothetical protein A3A80_00920 [Candidatus Terrybacteria bacterium RIFCSPLOWO2_01_FULL_44_24]
MPLKNSKNKRIFCVWVNGKGPAKISQVLKKKGESVEILGVFIGQGDEKRNLNVEVQHAADNTKSRVIVRGILSDKANIDFRGNVKIDKGARGSDAHLEAKAILLSEQARGRLEPYLEIDENDVRATHATYAGPLDENEIFYVRSRGLSQSEAQKLLVEGFLKIVVKNLSPKEQRLVNLQLARLR